MVDADVVVIGGGIAGASVAFHLTEADREVVIYERGELAGETTAKSAAFFGRYGSPLERRLKQYGLTCYNRFFADARTDLYYDLVGQLRVATTPDEARRLESRAEAVRAEFGSPVEYRPGSMVREALLLPEADTAVIEGALYDPSVGYFDPRTLALEFVARAQENGARFEPKTAVDNVAVEGGKVTGVVVRDEPIEARSVVCAAGPWNPTVAATAGVDLPVTHSLAPILRLAPPHPTHHTLPIIVHEESGVYLRGDRDGSLLVGHYPNKPRGEQLDPGSVDERVPNELRTKLWRVIEELLPPLADADVTDEWVGIRSHTPDGHPIVGWTPVEGFSVVAFDSSGIQLAPAAGWIVAQQVVHGRPTEYHDAVSLDRFDTNQ